MVAGFSHTATTALSVLPAPDSRGRRRCNSCQGWRGASIRPAPRGPDGSMVVLNYIVGMCRRATYKLTWEEIVALYRLTLDFRTAAIYAIMPSPSAAQREPGSQGKNGAVF